MSCDYTSNLPVVINGPFPLPVTGTFTPSGTQDVNIISSIVLNIAAASLPLPTGAATEATLADIEEDLDQFTFASTRLLIDGSGVTQPISGSITVSNFPATQPISGTVAVSNFPATQPVSGPLTDTQLRATPVPVTIPTPVPVTGTFFQATQPISATSLPLPTGAATETTLSTLNNNIAKEYGTWSYYAGTSGTVSVTAGQRVLSISCHATTAGTVTVNGGTSIPIPANVGFSINMTGILVAPTVIFTGTDSYFIEAVS